MSSEPDDWVIKADGIGKRYAFTSKRGWSLFGARRNEDQDGYAALTGVTLAVQRGETVGVLGRNGAGKSTLLQVLTGVVRPSEGSLRVQGRVGALLELGSGFNLELSGRENISLSGAVLGMSKSAVVARSRAIEEFAELGEFIDRPVKTYSSGMLVRLAFSIQVHLDPEVLIVDEALSVGDMFFQQKCIARIREMISQGCTLLFVSHSINAVKSLCQRAILLERGRLVADGPSDEVCERYQNSLSSTSITDLKAALLAASQVPEDSSGGMLEAVPSNADMLIRQPDFADRLSSRSGGGEVVFAGFEVVVPGLGPVLSIERAGAVLLRVQFRAEVDIATGSVLGLLVRDMHGIDIVAYNLNFYGRHLPAMAAGSVHVLEFEVDLPLAKGRYSFHVGLKPTPESPYFYDRCFTIGVLDIEGNPLSWGEYGGRLLASPKSIRLLSNVPIDPC